MAQMRGRPRGKFTQHRRLDQLRELLERHPKGLALNDLSLALGVSSRTLRRYLKEVGREYDLEPSCTRGGGKLLWRIPLRDIPRRVELRRTQAYALLASRRLFEPMRGTALFEEIELVMHKILSVANRPGRGPNAGLAEVNLEERFLYLPSETKVYSSKTEEIDELFQAVSDLRPMTMQYNRTGRAKDELVTVHPYALVWFRDAIYCIGLDVGRDEVRAFLLDRMRDVRCSTLQRFGLPENFRVDDYFQGELGIWRATSRQKIVLEFDAEAAPQLRNRRVHPTQKLGSLPSGGLRLTMSVGDLEPLVRWVLQWGRHARVIEPAELAQRIFDELRGTLANYRSPVTKGSRRRVSGRKKPS